MLTCELIYGCIDLNIIFALKDRKYDVCAPKDPKTYMFVRIKY